MSNRQIFQGYFFWNVIDLSYREVLCINKILRDDDRHGLVVQGKTIDSFMPAASHCSVLSAANPVKTFFLLDRVNHKFIIHARRCSQPKGRPWCCCINKSGAGVGVVVCGRMYDFYLISELEKNGLFLLIAQIHDLRMIKTQEYPTR